MIRFRRWAEHNRRALKDVAAKRRTRGIPDSAPLALQRVADRSRQPRAGVRAVRGSEGAGDAASGRARRGPMGRAPRPGARSETGRAI